MHQPWTDANRVACAGHRVIKGAQRMDDSCDDRAHLGLNLVKGAFDLLGRASGWGSTTDISLPTFANTDYCIAGDVTR
jgi:hypothetical protein